jgi:hypothetical protein
VSVFATDFWRCGAGKKVDSDEGLETIPQSEKNYSKKITTTPKARMILFGRSDVIGDGSRLLRNSPSDWKSLG